MLKNIKRKNGVGIIYRRTLSKSGERESRGEVYYGLTRDNYDGLGTWLKVTITNRLKEPRENLFEKENQREDGENKIK